MRLRKCAWLGYLVAAIVAICGSFIAAQTPSGTDKTKAGDINKPTTGVTLKKNDDGASSSNEGSEKKNELKNPDIIDGQTTTLDGSEQSAFTWPVLAVNFPSWQIAVIPAGNKNSPLNVTWTLSGTTSSPNELTLSYARKASVRQITSISTNIPGSATSFNWVPPSSIAEARDYFLILSDTSVSPSDNGVGAMRPIFSGFFAIFKENDLSRLPDDVAFARAAFLERPGKLLSVLLATGLLSAGFL